MSTKGGFRFPVGEDVATGDPVSWTQRDLRYGGFLTVAARGGKTTLAARLFGTLITRGAPAIIIDDAGELWHQVQRVVAWEAHRTSELLKFGGFSAHQRRVILKRKFLNRFSFGFLGVGGGRTSLPGYPQAARLPHRRESIEEVVSGNLNLSKHASKTSKSARVFLSVIGPCLAALIAAERPITEVWNPSSIRRTGGLSAMRSSGFACSQILRRASTSPQMQKLRRILDLRMTKTKNGPIEAEPFPQPYRDKVDSTLHAIEVYTPGTASSKMFTHDSFSPESVAFGRGVFALTSDITSELNRNLAISTIYTTFERMLKYRVPGQGNARYRLYLAIDEVRWMYETISRFFSTLNNHRVSAWVMNQDDYQWLGLGLPTLAKVLPKLLSGVRMRDAAGSSRIADEMALFGDPTTPSRAADRAHEDHHRRHAQTNRRRNESEGETESQSVQSREPPSSWNEASSEQDGSARPGMTTTALQHSIGSSGSSSVRAG